MLLLFLLGAMVAYVLINAVISMRIMWAQQRYGRMTAVMISSVFLLLLIGIAAYANLMSMV